MAIRRAKRSETFLKINVSSPSGGGKTYSSLKLAKGLVGKWEDIAVLDTEGGSADLYADLGEYGVLTMNPPFSPQRYVQAIEYFKKEGVRCMIIDSASHEWEGEGGCLDIHQSFGGEFRHWKDVTPMHRKFLEAINKTQMHIITTTRRKQEYALETSSKGKLAPKKIGLKEVQRDGYEYELTVSFDINIEHYAQASKDRTNMFGDRPPFIIDESIGEELAKWSQGGSVE